MTAAIAVNSQKAQAWYPRLWCPKASDASQAAWLPASGAPAQALTLARLVVAAVAVVVVVGVEGGVGVGAGRGGGNMRDMAPDLPQDPQLKNVAEFAVVSPIESPVPVGLPRDLKRRCWNAAPSKYTIERLRLR